MAETIRCGVPGGLSKIFPEAYRGAAACCYRGVRGTLGGLGGHRLGELGAGSLGSCSAWDRAANIPHCGGPIGAKSWGRASAFRRANGRPDWEETVHGDSAEGVEGSRVCGCKSTGSDAAERTYELISRRRAWDELRKLGGFGRDEEEDKEEGILPVGRLENPRSKV